MRSAAYKSLQERATRTVCSQATLPLYWLADIQFFQSFPEWHGVKFVAHHLCPHWLVTACTLWHSKQSNPNLLPAFEIRRGEGPWNADGSIWCFVKAEVPDHRYEENENQPLENPQAPETAHVRNMIGRGRLEVSVFVLLPDSPWCRAPGLLSRAGLNPLTSNAAQQWLWGVLGQPQHPYETSAHRKTEGQSCQGTVQIPLLMSRSKARGSPPLPGHTGCISDSLSLCGLANHRGVWFVDPVAVLLHQLRGLLSGAPWHRKGCRTAQKAELWKPAWDTGVTKANWVTKHLSFFRIILEKDLDCTL